MSKRAEEQALEIFPVKKVPYYGLSCNAYSERDVNFNNRTLFCMGYEQAEKDLTPLTNRLCEAILFDWDSKVELAREIQSKIKEENNGG